MAMVKHAASGAYRSARFASTTSAVITKLKSPIARQMDISDQGSPRHRPLTLRASHIGAVRSKLPQINIMQKAATAMGRGSQWIVRTMNASHEIKTGIVPKRTLQSQ